ncbi:hypothetical protein DPMN_163453 [Dreissena polymorpha]|uniref:Uncharacterized protein n=1 Tax=Dreissena polymorpha TaxID=45954 RepID=A0A9D4ES05_DREPO|nr:hypothetical protein DPMN_163453 [Dreissena polymorpha]
MDGPQYTPVWQSRIGTTNHNQTNGRILFRAVVPGPGSGSNNKDGGSVVADLESCV